jgi:hypothetical protein
MFEDLIFLFLFPLFSSIIEAEHVPSVLNRNDSGTIGSDYFPSWLCHVEMLPWWIAPSTIVAW